MTTALEREQERLKKIESKIPQVLSDAFRYYWLNSRCRGEYGCPMCDAIRWVCKDYEVDADEILDRVKEVEEK